MARAAAAGSNPGVSYGAEIGGPFLESYPETTGYIIPTFIELATRYDDSAWRDRAIAAGEWESSIQMAEGAVMGGRFEPGTTETPAVFNTGMVLLGWSALVRELNHESSRASAKRACDWLLSVQDPDGCWRRGNSQFAKSETTVYNVKAAWGPCEGGRALGDDAVVDGALRNAEFCLTQQRPTGWFANDCLSDSTRRTPHRAREFHRRRRTDGERVDRHDGRERVHRGPARPGVACRGVVVLPDGKRADAGIVLGQLYRLRGDRRHLEAFRRINRYLMRHHDVDNADPAPRGGVRGSWPVWGAYGYFKILNWATNFFVESLLIEHAIDTSAAHASFPAAAAQGARGLQKH